MVVTVLPSPKGVGVMAGDIYITAILAALETIKYRQLNLGLVITV